MGIKKPTETDRKIREDGARRKAAGEKVARENAARAEAEKKAAVSPKNR